MLAKLPGWIVEDEESVRAEVAEWIGTTAAERWKLAKLCAKDAVWAARLSGNRERILSSEDPLPASTIAALARLRAECGWPRADG